MAKKPKKPGWYRLRGPETKISNDVYFDGKNFYFMNVADPMTCDKPLKDMMLKVNNWRKCKIMKGIG